MFRSFGPHGFAHRVATRIVVDAAASHFLRRAGYTYLGATRKPPRTRYTTGPRGRCVPRREDPSPNVGDWIGPVLKVRAAGTPNSFVTTVTREALAQERATSLPRHARGKPARQLNSPPIRSTPIRAFRFSHGRLCNEISCPSVRLKGTRNLSPLRDRSLARLQRAQTEAR